MFHQALQQRQQMTAMQGGHVHVMGQPTAYGAPGGMPQGYVPAPTTAGAPFYGVNLKAIQLPDGVSMMSVNVAEISCRGPSGSIVTLRPPPPKPDFEREENVKPVPYASSKATECHKMGFKKTLGMALWHKRTLKIDGNKFEWNTKEHKVIELKPGVIIEKADHDSPKRKDAHDFSAMSALTTPMFSTHVGEVGKNYSIGIHVPIDPFATMNFAVGLTHKTPMQLMLNPGTLNKAPKNITYYFHFDSEAEREEWYHVLTQNLEAARTHNYVPYQFFVNLASQAGVTNAASLNWREILTALYSDQ